MCLKGRDEMIALPSSTSGGGFVTGGMEGAVCRVSPPRVFNMDEGKRTAVKRRSRDWSDGSQRSTQFHQTVLLVVWRARRKGKELSSSAKGTYRKWNDHPPCRSTETSGPANVTRTRGAIHKDEDQSGHLLPIQY